MKLEDILPQIRKGRKARRKGLLEFPVGFFKDIASDDWELVPEPVRVADYLVPEITGFARRRTIYHKDTHPIGQQPEGAVMVPGSERNSDE